MVRLVWLWPYRFMKNFCDPATKTFSGPVTTLWPHLQCQYDASRSDHPLLTVISQDVMRSPRPPPSQLANSGGSTRLTPCPYASTGELSFYLDHRSSHGQKGLCLPYSGSMALVVMVPFLRTWSPYRGGSSLVPRHQIFRARAREKFGVWGRD